MNQTFAFQLGQKIRKIKSRVQKIDGTILKTYRMIVSIFFILDKDNMVRFFEENFLLADVKLDLVLRILFLIINNVDIDFKT